MVNVDRWENKSSQQDFGEAFTGLQLESYEYLGWKYGIHTTLL